MTIDLNCDIGEAYGSYKCQTICRHSDTARAVEIARAVKDAIAKHP